MHNISKPIPNLIPVNEIYVDNKKVIFYSSNPFSIQIETGEIFSRKDLKNYTNEIICNGNYKKYIRKQITKKHLTVKYFSNAFLSKHNNPFKGKKHSEEFKSRLSSERKGTWYLGEKNKMFGKKFKSVIEEKYGQMADEKLKQHAEKCKKFGKENGFFGKKHSEETKQKLRETNKKLFTHQYWIDKGFSIEESIEKINKWKNNIQNNVLSKTNIERKYGSDSELIYLNFRESRKQTLERFIKLYGDEKGTEKFIKYKNKRIEILKKISNRGWSSISQNLFHFIYENFKNKYPDLKFHFATLNNGNVDYKTNKEYKIFYEDEKSNKRWFKLDFYIENFNFLIEYDCKRWHNKENDQKRLEIIKKLIPNIKILHINHEEYIKAKQREIIHADIIEKLNYEIGAYYNSQKN
jgi:hypothetical protein